MVVRRLVEHLHPERIYLFGSRGRGDWSDDSDYDFLVVLPDDLATGRRELERAAYRALEGLVAPKDVLVWPSALFERYRPVAASLAAAVEREGRLLYGTPPPKEKLSAMEAADRRAALARQWLIRAEEDLAMAKLGAGAEPPLLGNAVYHCQQAFEKALKGFLAWYDQPLRRAHLLPDLVEWCLPLDPDFANLADSAATVSPYVFRFRYPLDELEGLPPSVPSEPSREEAEHALNLAAEAVNFVLARLPSAARP
jgi:HEPN domain-containing protein